VGTYEFDVRQNILNSTSNEPAAGESKANPPANSCNTASNEGIEGQNRGKIAVNAASALAAARPASTDGGLGAGVGLAGKQNLEVAPRNPPRDQPGAMKNFVPLPLNNEKEMANL